MWILLSCIFNIAFILYHLCILEPVLLWHLICTNFLQLFRKCICLGIFVTNLHSIWCKFGFIILKYSNKKALVSKISAKEKKHHILCPIGTFLLKIRCRFMHILVGIKIFYSRINNQESQNLCHEVNWNHLHFFFFNLDSWLLVSDYFPFGTTN